MSPGGRTVTFASDRDGDFEIYTANLFAGEVRQVKPLGKSLLGGGANTRGGLYGQIHRKFIAMCKRYQRQPLLTSTNRRIEMKVRLVRHATLVVQLDSRTLLIDPMLGPVGEFLSFQPSPNNQRNPLVPLPDPDLTSILSLVDTCFVTHTHRDHFDQAAIDALRKDLPIFCQPEDEEKLRATFGFSSVQPVEENLQSDGIEVFRTGGQHGPEIETV